jgi:hydroxymethylpyrimidine/phosphomethylpyrimidine kinase
MAKKRFTVPLTIAGSDPTGGAGLQADLKVFLRYGLSGAAVCTATTAQSPAGVTDVHPVAASIVTSQLSALLRDVRPSAVKVGMLGSGENVRAVARALLPLSRRGVPIVVDPVLASGDGKRRLLPRADVPLLVRHLFPLATLVTPNIAEAAELTGTDDGRVRGKTDEVVRALLRAGCRNVLVKGGHMASAEAVDVLGQKSGELVLFSAPRVPRRTSVHGTGCALSAAIAALLAQGRSLEDAVQGAKAFVTAAIAGAKPIGRGERQLDFLTRLE